VPATTTLIGLQGRFSYISLTITVASVLGTFPVSD